MSAHHPSETVLAAYASGALADGPTLVVAAHLEGCAHCRGEIALLEAAAGALLDDIAPQTMDAQALDLALARIERPREAQLAAPPVRPIVGGARMPAALAGRKIGPRRWVAPGMWVAQVRSRSPDGWRTYLLRADKGAALPEHGHRGLELTQVLYGAFRDETGRYGPGDFGEAQDDLDHQPQVEADGPCLCLISAEGGMRAHGLVRLLQPILGV